MVTETPVVRTKSGPPHRLRPLWMRLGLLLVVFLAVDAVFAPLDSLAAHGATGGVVVGFGTGALALFAYAKLVGWLEQRDVPEVSPRTLWPQLPLGFLLGVTLFAATILLIFVAGGYHVAGRGSVTAMIATFGLMAGTAVFEELLFRGVLFRIVEERAGTILALVVSGLLFGGLHLLNPHATLGGALAIAIEAGLMLGAAYAATRTLWLPIGIHLGWNFAESGLFGSTVSGSGGIPGGLLKGSAPGSALISGGEFGPEASIFAVLIGGITTIVLLVIAHRRGRIVRASWR
jgi:uncharacterized protein